MKSTIKTTLFGLLAVGAQAATVADGWDSSVDFGLTMTRGNAETTLVTTNLNLGKTVGDDEYNAGVGYTFASDSADTITDELTGFFNWNHLVNDVSYYGFRLEGRRDDIARIDYRFQGTFLYGYYFINNDQSVFAIEAGPGFTAESLDGLEENYPHVYLGQRASHWITDNTKVFQSFAGYASLEDFSQYNFIFTLGIEALMNESLSLKVTFEDKYQSVPAVGAEKNDIRLVSGVSYRF